MNILYIHGLDSSPNPDRMGWLEAHGHQVFAQHIDYRSEANTYRRLKDEILRRNATFIVGSSLGGRLGFWLSEDLGLECLLFNPALSMDIPQLEIPALASLRCPKRYIVLGAKDDRIDPQLSWVWLDSQQRPDCQQYVSMYQWLGHQIDIHSFAMAARWAGLPTPQID